MLRLVLPAVVPTLLGACEPQAPEVDAISRETFVAAYVDLRKASLEGLGGPIDAAERERVLQEHGVEEDDLLRFAEVHGDDPGFMREVWEEIELRLQGPPPPDSAGASAGGASSPEAGEAGVDHVG